MALTYPNTLPLKPEPISPLFFCILRGPCDSPSLTYLCPPFQRHPIKKYRRPNAMAFNVKVNSFLFRRPKNQAFSPVLSHCPDLHPSGRFSWHCLKLTLDFFVAGEHSSGLHTFQCSWDVWDYCAAIGEY